MLNWLRPRENAARVIVAELAAQETYALNFEP